MIDDQARWGTGPLMPYATSHRQDTAALAGRDGLPGSPQPVPEAEKVETSSPAVPRMAGSAARLVRTAVLVAADLGGLSFAATVAYLLWALPVHLQPASTYLELLPLLGLFVLGYARAGLYPGFGLGPVDILRRLSYVTAFGFLVLASFAFALKLPHLYSRMTFAIAFGLALLFVPIARALVLTVAHRWSWWPEPVVIVGTSQRARQVISNLHEDPYLGYRPAVALEVEPSGESIADVPVVGTTSDAASLAGRGYRVALVDADARRDRALIDHLQQVFRHVILIRADDDAPIEGIQIRNLGQMAGIEYTNNLLRQSNRVVKRSLDVVVAATMLAITTPLMAVAVLLVRAIDGAPVLFWQKRAGLGGEPIAVPKIRTMRRDAEARLEAHLTGNPSLRAEWDTRFKLQHDPRLIPLVGRVLRRFSIDELPQLWTVLTGRMSLVGPRPVPDYHLEQFPESVRSLRRYVRPGLTGLWQISVRADGDLKDQQTYDAFYIRNWSVWLDLYILSRTLAVVLSGRGAY